MPEPEDERDGIVKWHALTHHEFWDETIQALAEMRCREANLVCVDYKRPDEERKAAGAKFEAWSEILSLRKQWTIAYEQMHETDSAEGASEDDHMVGSKLEEQWYEKTP